MLLVEMLSGVSRFTGTLPDFDGQAQLVLLMELLVHRYRKEMRCWTRGGEAFLLV